MKVWFSELGGPLGAPLLRQIDKGLVMSRAAVVLATPGARQEPHVGGHCGQGAVGAARNQPGDSDNRAIPIAHGTTFEALRDGSPAGREPVAGTGGAGHCRVVMEGRTKVADVALVDDEADRID